MGTRGSGSAGPCCGGESHRRRDRDRRRRRHHGKGTPSSTALSRDPLRELMSPPSPTRRPGEGGDPGWGRGGVRDPRQTPPLGSGGGGGRLGWPVTPPWAPGGARLFPLRVQASLEDPRLDLPSPGGRARHPSHRPVSHGLSRFPYLSPRGQARTVLLAAVAQARPPPPKLLAPWPQPAPQQPLSSGSSLRLFP